MARILPNSALYIFTISIFISFITILASGEEYSFVKAIDRKTFGLKKEKLSHFRLYWHDVVSGRHPTSVPVILPPFNSSTGFGTMNMMDNALTIEPDLSSKIVGRAQGFYASASKEELGFLMVMNLAITEGKYNGSTITVVGRNAVFNQVREMSVIGGSGLFRFARGYAEARTRKIDLNTGDATVEYNVYVMHY